MIRGSASPAAAGGRRGGRAAGLLPASLVTVAAAALFPSRPGGRSAERTRDQNVCFPVWGETAVVKWYVALGGKPVVARSPLCLGDCAEGCVRKLPWTCYRAVTTCLVLERCFHNLWLACWGIYFSTCQFAAYKELLLAATAAGLFFFFLFFPFRFQIMAQFTGKTHGFTGNFVFWCLYGTGLEKLAGKPVFVSMYL